MIFIIIIVEFVDICIIYVMFVYCNDSDLDVVSFFFNVLKYYYK